MRIIADTNVLMRAFLDDDVVQSRASRLALSSANQVVISQQAFCEMVWLLRGRYKMTKAEIFEVIRAYVETENVITDTAAVEAGLRAMEAGADFADGVIDYEGRRLAGETFVSFDKKAVAVLSELGLKTELLK